MAKNHAPAAAAPEPEVTMSASDPTTFFWEHRAHTLGAPREDGSRECSCGAVMRD